MWLLDTDHLTILERGGSTALPLQMRLGRVSASGVDTTIVSYEEQMRGWLSEVARANTPEKIIFSYALLRRHVENFRDFLILPFDETASKQFQALRQSRLSIGTKDLRIASICLANDATLLTRNLKDFSKVPGLRAEDWSS